MFVIKRPTSQNKFEEFELLTFLHILIVCLCYYFCPGAATGGLLGYFLGG